MPKRPEKLAAAAGKNFWLTVKSLLRYNKKQLNPVYRAARRFGRVRRIFLRNAGCGTDGQRQSAAAPDAAGNARRKSSGREEDTGMRKWRGWRKILLCAALGTLVASGCARYTPVEPDGGMPEAEETGPETAGGEPEAGTAQELSPLRIEDDGAAVPKRTPVQVKGIYLTAYTAGDPERMEEIIAQIDRTELNAVVIDFKTDEGYIAADVDSPLLQEAGACRDYIPDLEGLLKTLKKHEIYTIARVVAFKDPVLAEAKPEWSLKTADGSLYRDGQGLAWVNPYEEAVWNYLAEVGEQAAGAGFDEVQFDYIRFSTDSTMREVVFDEAQTRGRDRTEIITEFTEYIYERLAPLGIFVSADVFGAIIGSPQDAAAVGQDYAEMAARLDYLCPMIYPSHYGDGNFGLDHPDLHPYETVLGALQKSVSVLSAYENGEATPADASAAGTPAAGGSENGAAGTSAAGGSESGTAGTSAAGGSESGTAGTSAAGGSESAAGETREIRAVVRPWLQDFTASYLRHYQKYEDEEIREQIEAVYDAGYEEWILWNASNQYHYGGLLDEGDSEAGGTVPAL